MTEDKEISKKELKRLRTMIEQGQKLSISTKEFEKVFDEIERLEQESMTKSATFCNYEKQLDELKQENSLLSYNLGLKEGECDKLEQENKELKELNKKICEDWEKEIKVYWNALEEIRILATKNVSIENFVKIQNKINEVLKNEV